MGIWILFQLLQLIGHEGIDAKSLLNFGMLGMHGSAYANRIIDKADLMIAIGVRFSDRSTGNKDDRKNR